MDRRTIGRSVLAAAATLAAAACAGASAKPRQRGAVVAAAGSCARAQPATAAAARFAVRRYRLEATGTAVHAALHRVAADRALSEAVRVGDRQAADAAALREVTGHHHITAIRVLRGSRVFLQTTRYPFDVAGAGTILRDRSGAALGTVQVTIQDVIGFIRLVHRFTGSEVAVRGAAGQAKSSLAAALGARLPDAGCASLGGRTYAVRSFTETSFTGDTLTISVLRAA